MGVTVSITVSVTTELEQVRLLVLQYYCVGNSNTVVLTVIPALSSNSVVTVSVSVTTE